MAAADQPSRPAAPASQARGARPALLLLFIGAMGFAAGMAAQIVFDRSLAALPRPVIAVLGALVLALACAPFLYRSAFQTARTWQPNNGGGEPNAPILALDPPQEDDATSRLEAARAALPPPAPGYAADVIFRAIAQTANDAIISLDNNGKIVLWNPAAKAIFGYSPDEVIGQPYTLVVAERSLPLFQRGLEAVLATGETAVQGRHFETAGRRRDGSQFPVELSFSVCSTNEGVFVTAIVRDITDRKRHEHELAFLASHDPLTGLPNRRAIEEALHRACARARRGTPSALLFLDVDNFKVVNDTLGHAAGDRALSLIAQQVQESLRAEDIVARVGGDEFAVLLEGTTLENARLVAERTCRLVAERPVAVGGLCFDLGLSIGFANIEGNQPPAAVLAQADAAMYRAKERGRNKVVSYCPEEDDARGLSESGSIAARLHKALGEGGFVLHYQPVIHLASGAVAYHEALVRLSDEHGLLYPSGFIPLAERLGLMPQLTAWILREAALALHGKPNLHLSLNLSGLDLSDGDLVGLVGAFLREHDLAPGRLRFEIAETAVIKDPALAERRIRPLAILGCPCALDDFGAGLVSLVHLDDLPVDQVKVDGAAVRGLAHDPVKRAFVRAMQGLCAGYGKETVAEWVENADVARAVQALGVTYGQGYYFGRPSPHLLDRPEPLPILPPR